MTRIGSLCSGAGMLDMAALELFENSSMAWHADIDPAASKVLARHWPAVPNLGDISGIDWNATEPVDVLCAGYPCQPYSAAGRRKGKTDGRDQWPAVRRAIRRVRPRIVLLENVAGHRSMGFDRVLGDLAEDGLHAWWTCLRASDVGACHHRERLFIFAYDPSHAAGDGFPRLADRTGGSTARRGRQWHPAGSDGRPGGLNTLLPTPRATDGVKGGPNQHGSAGDLTLPSAAVRLLPTPVGRDSKGHNQRRDDTCLSGAVLPTPRVSDANGIGRHGTGGSDLRTTVAWLPTPNASDGSGGGMHPDRRIGHSRQLIDYALVDAVEWGRYATAIERQERLSRPAPAPTELNSRGNPCLSPAFVEWMMFWPPRWVTAPGLGLTRAQQLKILGNGVVPVQAFTAYSHLYRLAFEGAAA
ncbi:DNA cytosine methyltransferase [Nocardia nova]|uniref:DNA cytosine methyltransferase n=1 Tax=Nocardia nova TaxID=37330 RepID=UPI000CE9EA11|nr:DNA cytosine methyltransferase [Nocardia nova]